MTAANPIVKLESFVARLHNPDAGLLALRIMLGVIGLFHGSQKLFGLFGGPGISGFAGYLETLGVPAAHVSAVLAGAAEFLGGLLVLLGVVPRLAAIPFLATMLVACFTAHAGKISIQAGGMEYALSVAFMLIAVILCGPGKHTVSAKWIGSTAPSHTTVHA